jgi:hypothetical protein
MVMAGILFAWSPWKSQEGMDVETLLLNSLGFMGWLLAMSQLIWLIHMMIDVVKQRQRVK